MHIVAYNTRHMPVRMMELVQILEEVPLVAEHEHSHTAFSVPVMQTSIIHVVVAFIERHVRALVPRLCIHTRCGRFRCDGGDGVTVLVPFAALPCKVSGSGTFPERTVRAQPQAVPSRVCPPSLPGGLSLAARLALLYWMDRPKPSQIISTN